MGILSKIGKAYARKAAAKGARYLDKARPGWYRDIKTDELDLADRTHCVLGQLGGNYSTLARQVGMEEINIRGRSTAKPLAWLRGFIEPKNERFSSLEYYSVLTEAWLDQIAIRNNKDLF